MMWRWLGYSLLVLAGLALLVVPAISGTFVWDMALGGIGFVVYAAMGGLVIGHRRGQATGWLLVLVGVAVVLGNGFAALPGVDSRYVGWLDSWVWTLVFALFALLALTFPSGHGPTGPGFASLLGRVAIWTLPVLVMAAALTETLGGPEMSKGAASPVGFLPSWIGHIALTGTGLILVGAALSLVVRRRRSSGVERQQLTWVVFAIVVLVTVIGLTSAFIVASIALGVGDPGDTAWTAAFLVMILFPAAFAIAVLRYRLYEIDRIISRTVSYAIVVGMLAAVFAAIAVGLPQVLRLPTDNQMLVAAATLVAAALFNPLRKRAQSVVDRRFNRIRYDAAREVDRFAERLRTELDLDELTDEALGVVNTTLQPAAASVWIREG